MVIQRTLVHEVTPTVVELEYVPEEHDEHVVAPVLEKVPSAHFVHAEDAFVDA